MEKKPYLAAILRQVLYAGMFLISKAAFDRGMNNFVFVFYRQAAASLFLVPFAFFYERKTLPPLSFITFCKLFLLAFIGITLSLDINGVGLMHTSATLAAASTSCIPVFTFFFALLLGVYVPCSLLGIYFNSIRMEVLKLKTRSGIAKIVGIGMCIAGTLIFALYKGPHFRLWQHPIISNSQQKLTNHHASSGKTWILGCTFMLLSYILWALYIVLQGKVLKSYPSKLLFTAVQCLMSSIQSFGIAIAFVRDPKQWKLGWNLTLLTVAYCGIVVTGLAYYLQAWIIEKKGPVFLAMWTPLSLVVTIFCAALLLGEMVTLGSILGGLLLVGGLYSVLWGKSIETTQVLKVSSEVKGGAATITIV